MKKQASSNLKNLFWNIFSLFSIWNISIWAIFNETCFSFSGEWLKLHILFCNFRILWISCVKVLWLIVESTNESERKKKNEILTIWNILLFFFQWENHSKSMKLEAQTLAKIKTRINEKVMGCCGTWIDWQYLLDAAALLAKCRYTLQYTYPYAYYMEPSPRKELVSWLTCIVHIGNCVWEIFVLS